MNTPIPSKELVKQWIRDANHNFPMFPQVAEAAAQWGYKQRLIEEDQLLMQIVPPPELTENNNDQTL